MSSVNRPENENRTTLFDDPDNSFLKVRKSAEELMRALDEYYNKHPEECQRERAVVTNIIMRAEERADKDKMLACGCQYLRGERCTGQKGMPECTFGIGYCPFGMKKN
jgi:hypothetical protein